jgi:hypothetical protein
VASSLIQLTRGATERTLRAGVATRSNVLNSALAVAALHIHRRGRASARPRVSVEVAAPVLKLFSCQRADRRFRSYVLVTFGATPPRFPSAFGTRPGATYRTFTPRPSRIQVLERGQLQHAAEEDAGPASGQGVGTLLLLGHRWVDVAAEIRPTRAGGTASAISKRVR